MVLQFANWIINLKMNACTVHINFVWICRRILFAQIIFWKYIKMKKLVKVLMHSVQLFWSYKQLFKKYALKQCFIKFGYYAVYA